MYFEVYTSISMFNLMYDIVLHVKLIHHDEDCLKANITEEQCV